MPPNTPATPATRLRTAWRRLSSLPGGRRIFDRILGFMVPYSASIRPRVLALAPGRATVALRERRRLRNHFHSIHALALANLGELASGLAMTLALPADVRGIPIRLEVEYEKKARGQIVAEGRAEPPAPVRAELDALATADLTDGEGDLVATVVVTWRLSPREDPPGSDGLQEPHGQEEPEEPHGPGAPEDLGGPRGSRDPRPSARNDAGGRPS